MPSTITHQTSIYKQSNTPNNHRQKPGSVTWRLQPRSLMSQGLIPPAAPPRPAPACPSASHATQQACDADKAPPLRRLQGASPAHTNARDLSLTGHTPPHSAGAPGASPAPHVSIAMVSQCMWFSAPRPALTKSVITFLHAGSVSGRGTDRRDPNWFLHSPTDQCTARQPSRGTRLAGRTPVRNATRSVLAGVQWPNADQRETFAGARTHASRTSTRGKLKSPG